MSWFCSIQAPLKQETDPQGHGAHCQSLDFLNETNMLRYFFLIICSCYCSLHPLVFLILKKMEAYSATQKVVE